MKRFVLYIFSTVLLFIFISCVKISHRDLKNVYWLLGTWQYNHKDEKIYEKWTINKDSFLNGKSYVVNGQDTIIIETLEIIKEKDKLIYIAKVKDQNNGLPIRFISKKITDNEIIFENKKHDFPQLIKYTKIMNDSLVVEISNIDSSKIPKKVISMKRILN